MAKLSPMTDASTKAPSPMLPALQTTERERGAPTPPRDPRGRAATGVRGARLVGPTMTALGPIVTPSPRITGPTRRAVEWTFAVAWAAPSPGPGERPQG